MQESRLKSLQVWTHSPAVPLFGLELYLAMQENLMEVMGDHHSAPNIDIHFCGLSGQILELPPELNFV